jgi:hypothetical protein
MARTRAAANVCSNAALDLERDPPGVRLGNCRSQKGADVSLRGHNQIEEEQEILGFTICPILLKSQKLEHMAHNGLNCHRCLHSWTSQ